MTKRTAANYKSTNDSLITTNGVGDVSGADVNVMLEDAADSFYNLADASLSTAGDALALWSKSSTSVIRLHVINTSATSFAHASLKLESAVSGGDPFIVFQAGTYDVTMGVEITDATRHCWSIGIGGFAMTP